MQSDSETQGAHERAAGRRQGKAVNRRFRQGAGSGRSSSASSAPAHSFGARVRYWFDTALSRGPSVVIGWLGLLTVAIIIVAALVMTIFRVSGINGGDKLHLGEAMWQSLLRVLDAGTFAGDTRWWTRILSLVVTLCGIFIAGSLIGLIANAVDQRIEDLRKGRSSVLEHGHTLILGWSDRVPAIVKELIIANESEKRAAVVLLAEDDKTTMEDTLRGQIDDFKTTRLVCRSGSTSSLTDLGLVNVTGARSIVVIGGNDAAVVKTLLALRAVGTGAQGAPVVAEVNDGETARSIRSLFGERIAIVNSDAVVAELTAQACRQRGLSQVFRELLDFDGDEIYFAAFPQVVGRTYAEAQMAFDTSSLMGVLTAAGELHLNPSPETVIAVGDELVAVAADDSTFVFSGIKEPSRQLVPVAADADAGSRRMVLVGWSALGPRVVSELDEFLGSETTLEIIVDPEAVDVEDVRAHVETRNITVEITTHDGGPEELSLHAARRAFNEVIVLGRRDGITSEEADARTLLTLLAFNQVVHKNGLGAVRIVAELLEQRHAPLAQATGADDFIVSDELTSLMMAQLSERHELDALFRDLFDRDGCTIELVAADRLGAASASCFGDVVAAASAQQQSAIGYRRSADGVVVVNPTKSAALSLSSADAVVVLK